MLDTPMRRLIDPPLNRAGRALAARGVTADAMTLAGLAAGLVAALLIAAGAGAAALVPLGLGRLADGLDGAVARATRRSDFGGYLDITCDFRLLRRVPARLRVARPGCEWAGRGVSADQLLRQRRELSLAMPSSPKSAGSKRGRRARSRFISARASLKGTETILFFAALCVWPSAFAPLGIGFGALCLVTALARVLLARRTFG